MLKSSKRINQVRTKMVCISKSLRCSLIIFLGEPWIESNYPRPSTRDRQERALVMELLHRYRGLKQRIISERFGSLDDRLVSRDRRVIQEKIGTEPKIRK